MRTNHGRRESRGQYSSTQLFFLDGLIPTLNPPPDITIDEWADENVWLGQDVTSQPGPWCTDFAPYQRGIMQAVSDSHIEKVVIMKAARTGITYSAVLNVIGYYIQYDPCQIILVYPTEQNAKKFSKKNLSPFIRDCAAIRGLIAEPRSRDGDNTILLKKFPGGSLTLVGANSPNSMRVDTAKIVIIDEADGEVEASEGDFIKLAENRTLSYSGRGRKIIILSTPKDKGTSLIEAEYENSTKEEFNLPCPSCGEMQPLKWTQLIHETVLHRCRECEVLHSKSEWMHKWEETGQWIANNPGHPTRGFHVNALYSPFLTWESLVEEWRVASAESDAGQHGKLQVFINTALGETWEVRGEKLNDSALMNRREVYYGKDDVVPDGVCVITIAVDTQDNRLAVDVIGWGAGQESWRLGYQELWGDPRVPGSTVWAQLDEVVSKSYFYTNGIRVPVVCTTIDMGGHAPDQVCTYAKARQRWNVWAIRGVSGGGKLLVHSTVKSKVASATVFNLAVDAGKDDVVARLKINNPGPGYCHFPRGTSQDHNGEYESVRGYDERYFAGLTAEKKVPIRNKSGFQRYAWQKPSGQANEPFDLAVYNLAALTISKVNLDRIAAKAPWMMETPACDVVHYKANKANATASSARKPLNKQSNKNAYTLV